MKTITEKIKTVLVTDSNGKECGNFKIKIGYFANNIFFIVHSGQRYKPTGKSGKRFDSGLAVIELASPDDYRIWVDCDCNNVWED